MTPKEIIEILKEELDEWLKWADADDAYWTAQKYVDAYEMAIDAIKKADKYRWHDLRKDPTDLPPCEHEVEIAYKRVNHIGTTRAIYEDGTMHSEYSDFCYTELDEWCEYCEDTDDYIIPCGWIETTKFAENMGTVDVEVIAWREIEPFEIEPFGEVQI